MLAALRQGVLLFGLAAAGVCAAGTDTAAGLRDADAIAQGRALYLEGRRLDGTPLRATRAGGLLLAGQQAACVNCHRRSAMGGAEGRSYIPPITSDTL